uniref:Uncharacterized protein n=1 Tax=Oncorhynchus tshawytscha TaxID=74940 RepID=A0A8C8LQJ1_ONCTS
MALRKGSSSVALSGWSSEVQMNPADVPGLEVKLGALVVLFSITLVVASPLCSRGAGDLYCSTPPQEHHLFQSSPKAGPGQAAAGSCGRLPPALCSHVPVGHCRHQDQVVPPAPAGQVHLRRPGVWHLYVYHLHGDPAP